MDVPAIVTEALDLTGLKQGSFAKKVRVTQGTISKWISGQQSPNKSQWDTVTEFLARDFRTRHLVGLPPDPLTWVPQLDWVAAGKLTEPTSQIPHEDVPLLAFADLGRGDFFALRVQGNSMDRYSPEGSIIVVNKADRTLISGKCYVFSLRGKTTYKRWHGEDPPYLAPYSTDPSHEPTFVGGKKGFEVVGRVRRTVLDL